MRSTYIYLRIDVSPQKKSTRGPMWGPRGAWNNLLQWNQMIGKQFLQNLAWRTGSMAVAQSCWNQKTFMWYPTPYSSIIGRKMLYILQHITVSSYCNSWCKWFKQIRSNDGYRGHSAPNFYFGAVKRSLVQLKRLFRHSNANLTSLKLSKVCCQELPKTYLKDLICTHIPCMESSKVIIPAWRITLNFEAKLLRSARDFLLEPMN